MSLILKLKRINYNNEMKEDMNSIYIISKAVFFQSENFKIIYLIFKINILNQCNKFLH
jgi:hypothetical protein